MPDNQISVRRIAVGDEPLLDNARYDYADAFELRLDRADAHSAKEWVRTGLEQPALRRLILLVHRHILRFHLGPQDEDHILGWRIVMSDHDVLHLRVGGGLGRAVIVARRTSPTTSTATTFVFFDSTAGPRVWRVVGPLHRRVAPYLLKHAARALSRQTSPA